MIIFNYKKYAPTPRNETNPITSVIVVTKTLEDIAGSMFIFFNVTGTKIPNSPATIIVNIIEIEIIIERMWSLNQACTINELITAKIIPFKTPMLNSLNMLVEKLFLVR